MSLSLNDQTRKNACIAIILIALLIVSLGVAVYEFLYGAHLSSALAETTRKKQKLDYTVSQVNATAPKVTISLRFTPTPPTKTVYPNTITFLTGFLTATDLSELLFPCTMVANFTISHTTTNPNATIEYSHTPYQYIYLTKGIQHVEVPVGVYPLTLSDTHPGDQVILYMTARVKCLWDPVGAIMVDQAIAGQFNIFVVGEG